MQAFGDETYEEEFQEEYLLAASIEELNLGETSFMQELEDPLESLPPQSYEILFAEDAVPMEI